jgi:hypothetical protein
MQPGPQHWPHPPHTAAAALERTAAAAWQLAPAVINRYAMNAQLKIEVEDNLEALVVSGAY